MADDPQVPFARSRDTVDAANLPFTPATVANWTGSADPGSTKAALDQLADRLKTNETTDTTQTSNIAAVAAAQRRPTITIGAEGAGVAEAIDVGITVVDGIGAAVASTDRILIELFSDRFYTTATNAAAFPITDNGSGSVVATDAGVVKVLFDTSAAGALQFRITDSATGSANTLYGRGTYLGASGVRISAAPFFFQVTFTA